MLLHDRYSSIVPSECGEFWDGYDGNHCFVHLFSLPFTIEWVSVDLLPECRVCLCRIIQIIHVLLILFLFAAGYLKDLPGVGRHIERVIGIYKAVFMDFRLVTKRCMRWLHCVTLVTEDVGFCYIRLHICESNVQVEKVWLHSRRITTGTIIEGIGHV